MSKSLEYPPVQIGVCEAFKSQEATKAGTSKLDGVNLSASTEADLGKNEHIVPDCSSSKTNVPFRPQFKPTSTRIETFKQIATSSKGGITIEDIDTYLQGQQVYLTSDELSVLLTDMSTRKRNIVTISEFYKYCPSKGEFAQKVWESIVLRR